MAVSVITDSASSLPQHDAERLRVGVVSLYVIEGDVQTRELEIDLPAFYERIAPMRVLPTTSQPSPEDFADAFAGVVAGGDDALAVLISSEMSSTYRAAQLGAEIAREQYPDARIVLVDSGSNSMQEGFAVLSAAEAAAQGGDLAACEAAARATMVRTRYLFAPRSLDYLQRGGRISAASALLGSTLRIVPILTAKAGATGVAGKVRTHGKALAHMAALMRADVARYGFRRAAVQAIADLEGAARFAREMIEPIAGAPVPVIPAAATIGVHVGPAIGVAYETADPMT